LSKSVDLRPKKVFCVTLNTAIDHIIEVDELDVGATIRSTVAELVPAGKGVDVAVGVAILGGYAVATGFIGEKSREVFAGLQSEQVELLFIEVPGSTRINVTILERKLSRETHLQTVGYSISQADVEQLNVVFDRSVTPGDVVVIGGSLPPGSPDGLAAALIALCKVRGAYVILDSSGAALLDGLRAGPQMVKPNLLELAQIVGRPVDDSDTDILEAAQECLSLGVTRVVVSRGYRGILVIEREHAWKAWLDSGRSYATASVGSGDAVVAAFALSTLQDRSIEESMRLGVACGAGNLLTKLPGRFRAEDVTELLPSAQVQRIL
jgi:1-phosphofructokinase family hexose kinase